MNNCISIIIPFYNGESFFAKLLNTLKISIERSEGFKFQIIMIIDSAKTDKEYVQKVIDEIFNDCDRVESILRQNQLNLGVAGSRNLALTIAEGDYLHLIDQDDEVHEDFYKAVIPSLSNYNYVISNGLVTYSNVKYNSHLLYYVQPKLDLIELLKNDFIRSPGQVVFSRELLKGQMFPDPKNYKGADDRFFWIKMFVINEGFIKPHYIKQPLYIANIHQDNYSADQTNLSKSSLENWQILQGELNLNRFQKIISANIKSIRYAVNEKMDWRDRLTGKYNRILYFLEPNKIIRFFYKRIKW